MVLEQFQSIAEPLVKSLGFEYWGAEYRSGEALLRLYIDSGDGITVDDCANVSRELSVVLDVEDIVPNQYRLEVSSPGMRRQFFSLDQYKDFVGFLVKLKLRYPFEGRRNFKGTVSAIDQDQNELAIIVDSDEEYVIPFEQVEKGVLVPEFGED